MNKEITIFINRKITEFTDQELVTEIIKRIDSNSLELSALTQIFMIIGKIPIEQPDLYLKLLKEIQK